MQASAIRTSISLGRPLLQQPGASNGGAGDMAFGRHEQGVADGEKQGLGFVGYLFDAWLCASKAMADPSQGFDLPSGCSRLGRIGSLCVKTMCE
jgi:hypothetical protein